MRRKIIKVSSLTVFFIVILLVSLNPDLLKKLDLKEISTENLVYNYGERLTVLAPNYDTASARVDRVTGNIIRKDYSSGGAIILEFPPYSANEDVFLNFTLLKSTDLEKNYPLPANKKLLSDLSAEMKLVPDTFTKIDLGIVPKLNKETTISFLYKYGDRSLKDEQAAIHRYNAKTKTWEKLPGQEYIPEGDYLTISTKSKTFGIFTLLKEVDSEETKKQIESLQNQLKFLLEKLKKSLSGN